MECVLLIKDNNIVDITHSDPTLVVYEMQLPEPTYQTAEIQQFTLVQPEAPSYILDLVGLCIVFAVVGFALHKRQMRKELDEQFKRFNNPRYTAQTR